DRGLIPRSVSALFEALSSRPDREDLEISASFYELYKDSVIDLLSSRRRKVPVKQGESGPTLVGLLRQVVATESDAYRLLFQGDSNRHFERFPQNSETSRGHVFYLLHINHAITGNRTSLAFVDLAAPIGARNSANTAIAESLDALKAALLAMRDGREPSFESSILPQLLEPWLCPAKGQPQAHVALINPVRYSMDNHQETHEWLAFIRLAQEAHSGQPLVHSPSLRPKNLMMAHEEYGKTHQTRTPPSMAAKLPLWGSAVEESRFCPTEVDSTASFRSRQEGTVPPAWTLPEHDVSLAESNDTATSGAPDQLAHWPGEGGGAVGQAARPVIDVPVETSPALAIRVPINVPVTIKQAASPVPSIERQARTMSVEPVTRPVA
ncbi:unnamed protein product, partial [Polarella glacialis]